MKRRLVSIISRYNGYCAECRRKIGRGAECIYDWDLKRTLCTECGKHVNDRAGQLFERE